MSFYIHPMPIPMSIVGMGISILIPEAMISKSTIDKLASVDDQEVLTVSDYPATRDTRLRCLRKGMAPKNNFAAKTNLAVNSTDRGCVGYFTERQIADENSVNEFQIDKWGERGCTCETKCSDGKDMTYRREHSQSIHRWDREHGECHQDYSIGQTWLTS